MSEFVYDTQFNLSVFEVDSELCYYVDWDAGLAAVEYWPDTGPRAWEDDRVF